MGSMTCPTSYTQGNILSHFSCPQKATQRNTKHPHHPPHSPAHAPVAFSPPLPSPFSTLAASTYKVLPPSAVQARPITTPAGRGGRQQAGRRR